VGSVDVDIICECHTIVLGWIDGGFKLPVIGRSAESSGQTPEHCCTCSAMAMADSPMPTAMATAQRGGHTSPVVRWRLECQQALLRPFSKSSRWIAVASHRKPPGQKGPLPDSGAFCAARQAATPALLTPRLAVSACPSVPFERGTHAESASRRDLQGVRDRAPIPPPARRSPLLCASPSGPPIGENHVSSYFQPIPTHNPSSARRAPPSQESRHERKSVKVSTRGLQSSSIPGAAAAAAPAAPARSRDPRGRQPATRPAAQYPPPRAPPSQRPWTPSSCTPSMATGTRC
jgi:hypothetical protein